MIGIYGGTFDPVHFGHLRTALEVKEIFALDEIRLLPCLQPAHREIPLSPAEMRFEMLNLALKNQPGMVVDRQELDRKGFSYMIDTLKSLRNELPNTSLLLFMGTDAHKGLTGWHQWQRLFDYAHIVVVTRPGYQQLILSDFFSSRLAESIEILQQEKAGYLFFQTVTGLDISASKIRHIIEADLNPGFLLPQSVINYINQNKLYKSVNASQ